MELGILQLFHTARATLRTTKLKTMRKHILDRVLSIAYGSRSSKNEGLGTVFRVPVSLTTSAGDPLPRMSRAVLNCCHSIECRYIMNPCTIRPVAQIAS